jgi:hypothetical protein
MSSVIDPDGNVATLALPASPKRMMAPAPKLLSISSKTRANAFFFASAALASPFASPLAAAARTTRELLFDAYARVAPVARTVRARDAVVVVIFISVDCIVVVVVVVVDVGSLARARLETVRTLEDVNARAIARLSMRSRVPSRARAPVGL